MSKYKKYLNNISIDILLLILISFSPLMSIYLKVVILILYLLLNFRYLLIRRKTTPFLFIITIILLLFGILFDIENVDNIKDLSLLNYYIPLTFIIGFIVSNKYHANTIFTGIDKVVFILAVLSIIGVLVYSFFPALVNFFPSYTYYNTTHKTAIIFNILVGEGGVIRRNAGIAWEPGAFQFLLNFGFYSYLITKNKLNLLKVMIYIIAIASTISTMGYVIFLIISIKFLKQHKFMLIIYLLLIFLLWDQIYSIIKYQIDYKLIGSYAFETRFEPMINAFNVGIDNFWGIGSTGYNKMLRYRDIGSYDSFSQILMRYGFPLFLCILLQLFHLVRINKWAFIIVTLTFFSQTVWFLPFTTIFYYLNKEPFVKS